MPMTAGPSSKLGWAWIALCVAFCIHVVDEASTNFLSIYNPTVTELRERHGWFPMPTFGFKEWLFGLVTANITLLCLSPLVFRGGRKMRALAYFLAIIMLLNGMGHTLGTIAGRTVASVRFPRPMSGFYSSPLLLATSLYMLYCLRSSSGNLTPKHGGGPTAARTA